MKNNFWQIQAAQSKDNTDVWINGYIGESFFTESTSAASFISHIEAIKTPRISVYINSRGGSVVDGIAIFNALVNHPAKITTINAASAMSIASLILQAGSTRQAYGNAMTMVHDSSTGVYGNAEKHQEIAGVLEKFNAVMSATYESKGIKKETIQAMLDGKDHYYTPTEAKELGLIDEITEHLSVAASADAPSLVPDHLANHHEANSSSVDSKENGLLAKIGSIFQSSEKTAEIQAGLEKQQDKVAEIEAALSLLADNLQAMNLHEKWKELETCISAVAELKAKIEATPQPNHQPRPTATGTEGQMQTDC